MKVRKAPSTIQSSMLDNGFSGAAPVKVRKGRIKGRCRYDMLVASVGPHP